MNNQQPDPGKAMQTEQEFLMQAPLLKNLEAQIRTCRSQREWAILRAKQAIYLARTHRIEEAAAVPDELRRMFRGNEDPEVFVWIWLVEAVADFYSSVSTRRVDLLVRAHSVAKSVNLGALSQYSAAWLANSYLHSEDSAKMAFWLRASGLELADYDEAICRSGIVLGVAFQTISDERAASRWFGIARKAAQRIGDRATIMASIENNALMRLDRLWVNHEVGHASIPEVAAIESELLGALHYERITGSDAFLAQGDVALVRLHILRGNLESALHHLDLLPDLVSDHRFSTASALAIVREWLLSRTDPSYVFDEIKFNRLERQLDDLDDDDAFVCAKFMLSVLEAYPDAERAVRIQGRAGESYGRYRARLDGIRSAIESLELKFP